MDLNVFIVNHEVTCAECGTELQPPAWISLGDVKAAQDRSRQQAPANLPALCLACADLDYLIFLPSGDAALTRRAKKYSTRSAVVLQWIKTRKRYERQGLLVEKEALEKAEQECLADSEIRARRREREAVRRETLDHVYIEQFATRIRALFPKCPNGEELAIAAHACEKHSGRVGRTAMAKSLEEKAVRLAVIAHIRHTHTNYDARLAAGEERSQARAAIEAEIDRMLNRWGER